MDTLEKIKTEYMTYENDCIPKNVKETRLVTNTFVSCMSNTINNIIRAADRNCRDEQITIIKNYFYDFFGYEVDNVDCFQDDNVLLLRHNSLAEKYRKFFLEIKEKTNEYNFIDMCSLAMFTYDSYQSNFNYIEALRDRVVYRIRGITYYAPGEDSVLEFETFFTETIKSITSKKREYKK